MVLRRALIPKFVGGILHIYCNVACFIPFGLERGNVSKQRDDYSVG